MITTMSMSMSTTTTTMTMMMMVMIMLMIMLMIIIISSSSSSSSIIIVVVVIKTFFLIDVCNKLPTFRCETSTVMSLRNRPSTLLYLLPAKILALPRTCHYHPLNPPTLPSPHNLYFGKHAFANQYRNKNNL